MAERESTDYENCEKDPNNEYSRNVAMSRKARRLGERQKRDNGDDGNNRYILEQQYGKPGSAHVCGQQAFLVQQLQGDSGRG